MGFIREFPPTLEKITSKNGDLVNLEGQITRYETESGGFCNLEEMWKGIPSLQTLVLEAGGDILNRPVIP
jgi:hypothetical protein